MVRRSSERIWAASLGDAGLSLPECLSKVASRVTYGAINSRFEGGKRMTTAKTASAKVAGSLHVSPRGLPCLKLLQRSFKNPEHSINSGSCC